MTNHEATLDPSKPSAAVPQGLLGGSLPDGFWTVWGFLDHFEPGALGLMDDPVTGLLEDDVAARKVAMLMGEPAVMMRAPEALRAARAQVIGGYTRATLERLYPI